MIDQDFAERLAPIGVANGYLVSTKAGSEPSHTMRQSRGTQSYLRVSESLAAFPQHLFGRNPQIGNLHHGVAARHRVVDGVRNAFYLDCGIRQVDQKKTGTFLRLRHDDSHPCALRTGDECFSAIDNPLPAVEHRGRFHHGRIRACSTVVGRLAHKERRTATALNEWIQEALLEKIVTDLPQQIHIAFIGSGGVACQGTQRRQPCFLQDKGSLSLCQVTMIVKDMRRKYSSRSCKLL